MIRIDSRTGFSRGSRGAAANGESDIVGSIHESEGLCSRNHEFEFELPHETMFVDPEAHYEDLKAALRYASVFGGVTLGTVLRFPPAAAQKGPLTR